MEEKPLRRRQESFKMFSMSKWVSYSFKMDKTKKTEVGVKEKEAMLVCAIEDMFRQERKADLVLIGDIVMVMGKEEQ